MTCKDCPHFDVCKMYGALPTKKRIDSKWKNCPFRNDKTKYIELPDPHSALWPAWPLRSAIMKNENEKTTVAILATICRDVCIYGSINNRCGLDKPELDEHCQRCALAQIKEVTLK